MKLYIKQVPGVFNQYYKGDGVWTHERTLAKVYTEAEMLAADGWTDPSERWILISQ